METSGSGINDPVLKDGFSAQDVKTLAEWVIDLRPIPSCLLFQGGLVTTWDFLGFRSVFKDTEGNVVTMSEYLRFSFMSGATIEKGNALTNQDLREQHTVPPLLAYQATPNKTDHQKEVEIADPKVVAIRERKAHAAAKKREKKKRGADKGEGSRPQGKRKKTSASRRDSSATSRSVSSLEPIRVADPAGPNTKNPSGAAGNIAESQGNQSLHNSHHDSANNSVHEDQTVMNLTLVPTEVLQSSPGDHSVHRSSTAERATSPARLSIQGAHADEGESSSDQAYNVPEWFIHRRCRSLRLYLEMSERFKKLKNDHAGCTEQVQLLEGQNSELSQVNKDQALKIKELEDTLARKDSALVYAERINAERAQKKERLSLSKPFYLAIQACWGKGLAKERSEEEILGLMSRMENFDAYADKKIRVEYDKLFEKRYPYVEKISRGFCHTVSDILKVYPDSLPSRKAPSSKPSSGKAPSSFVPRKT
nr:hypothetical protein [Tanacetum cinerariifolium]